MELSLFIGYYAIILLVRPTWDQTGLYVAPKLKWVWPPCCIGNFKGKCERASLSTWVQITSSYHIHFYKAVLDFLCGDTFCNVMHQVTFELTLLFIAQCLLETPKGALNYTEIGSLHCASHPSLFISKGISAKCIFTRISQTLQSEQYLYFDYEYTQNTKNGTNIYLFFVFFY